MVGVGEGDGREIKKTIERWERELAEERLRDG
jgi:hypothetical protein